MIEIGDEYYDEYNGDYVHVVGYGAGKGVYQCLVYSFVDEDLDFIISGLILLYDYEIKKYKLIKKGAY